MRKSMPAARALELLGRAGHDGHHEDVLGLPAQLFGVVGLSQRAEHLLRRLAGGEVWEHVGVEMLHVVDPSWRAAGEHRKGYLLAVEECLLQACEQLGTLFHDGQVGGEVRVEHGIEAEPPERGDHLSGHQGAGLVVELLTESAADRGRGLHDDMFLRVAESSPDLIDSGVLGDGSDRADRGALATLDAHDVAEVLRESRTDNGGESPSLRKEAADALDFVADGHAAPAHHALSGVACESGSRRVIDAPRLLAFVGDAVDAQVAGEIAELAIAVARTHLAVSLVLREQKLDHGATALAYSGRVGLHDHGFSRRLRARSDQSARALDLYQAYPAGAYGLHTLQIAERRDVGAYLAAGREEHGALGYLEVDPVDRQDRHDVTSPSISTAGAALLP
jgi:hypothetical protein